MSPRETVRGWAFFEVPEDMRLDSGDAVRIFVKDVEGREMTQVAIIEEDPHDTLHGSASFQYSNEDRDLRKLVLRYWTEIK